MELSEADFQYDGEDAAGVALAQAFAMLLAVVAVLVAGSHYIGIVGEFDVPFKFPYAGVIGPPVGVAALAMAGALPARFSRVWNEPRGRKRIVTGLMQISVTAIAVAVMGYFLAGAAFDLGTSGQPLLRWVNYGMMVGGAAHLLIALNAFVMLLLKRDLPDGAD